MKSERIELGALAAAHGPMLNAQEIETARYLAEFTEACRAVAETPQDVRLERVQAVRDLLVRPADAEAVRAKFWSNAPLAVRMVAVMSVRIPKDRANDALASFDALERGLMWNALEKLMGDLQIVQKCMNGGRMPSPAAKAH